MICSDHAEHSTPAKAPPVQEALGVRHEPCAAGRGGASASRKVPGRAHSLTPACLRKESSGGFARAANRRSKGL